MASGCPPPFGDAGEMREGFLCPLCLKDLQSFHQLQAHYEEEHSGEDGDVRAQLKSKRRDGGFMRSRLCVKCRTTEAACAGSCPETSKNAKILTEVSYR